jgi:hypothetical protein
MRRMENFLVALTSLAPVLNSNTLKKEKIPSNCHTHVTATGNIRSVFSVGVDSLAYVPFTT